MRRRMPATAWSICLEVFNGRSLAIGPATGVLNSHPTAKTEADFFRGESPDRSEPFGGAEAPTSQRE